MKTHNNTIPDTTWHNTESKPTYLLRRIELKMAAAVQKRSIEEIMDDMRHLHYVLSVKRGSRAPERRLGTPRKTQSEVLSAFGYHVDESGVLQGPGS